MKSNFNLWTYMDQDINRTKITEPLYVKDYGIDRVHVTMNLFSLFEKHDKDLTNVVKEFDDAKKNNFNGY